MEKQNSFFTQLEEAVKTLKVGLIQKQASTQILRDSADANRRAKQRATSEAQSNIRKVQDYLAKMTAINIKAVDASLVSKNMSALADITNKDSIAASAALGKAAKSIEQAHTSIAQLYSDAASIRAKASTEDNKTEISKLAQEAYEKSEIAAKSSEETTVKALHTTIHAAKSQTLTVQGLAKNLAADIDTLAKGIAASYASASANAATAVAGLAAAVVAERSAELDAMIADNNYSAAASANGADAIQLGLIEAEKEVRKEKLANTKKV